MKYSINIKADTNDADYVSEMTEITITYRNDGI